MDEGEHEGVVRPRRRSFYEVEDGIQRARRRSIFEMAEIMAEAQKEKESRVEALTTQPEVPAPAQAPTPAPASPTRSSSAAGSRAAMKTSLTADFVRSEAAEESNIKSKPLRIVAIILKSSITDLVFLCIVICDISLNCVDIDSRANDRPTPRWVESVGIVFLFLYTAEFAATLAVQGLRASLNTIFAMDIVILVSGYLELLMNAMGSLGNGAAPEEMGMVRLLRVVRIMRLVRIVRKSHWLKELRKLMTMVGSCFKTLAWSFVFLFLVVTVWSMLAVEVVHPVITKMAAEGEFDGCYDCSRSFQTVMRANLTFFKTIISGDSWGSLAVPVIERQSWTAFVFCGALLSTIFGVLNLVVAVVVDTAAEQRQKDVMFMAMDMDHDREQDLKFLTGIFSKIDEDGSGELDISELIKGARQVPEFQSRLRVMDIDEEDLIQFFHMLDQDGGGTVSPDEFKLALSRWLHDSKTATRFIKYQVMTMAAQQLDLTDLVLGLTEKVEQIQPGSVERAKVERVSRRSTSSGAQSLKSPQENETLLERPLSRGVSGSISGETALTTDDIALERKVIPEQGVRKVSSRFSRNGLFPCVVSADPRCNKDDIQRLHEPNHGLLLAAQDARSSLQAVLSSLEQALAAGLPQSLAKPQEEGAGLRSMVAKGDVASHSKPEFEDLPIDFSAATSARTFTSQSSEHGSELPSRTRQNFGPACRPAQKLEELGGSGADIPDVHDSARICRFEV